MKIAIIGASGFVGQAICKEASHHRGHEVIAIRRQDNFKALIANADAVIHCANPAKRFWAELNPELDFQECIEKTYNIVHAICGQNFVLISSISARVQLDTVYGRHRRAAEMIAESPKTLTIRLGPMFGNQKQVGPLHDIIANKPVYLSDETQYAYVPVEYNAKKIIESVENFEPGLKELGAKNRISLRELSNLLNSTSTFEGKIDTQYPLSNDVDAPDAYDVIPFARSCIGQTGVIDA